MIQDCYQLSGYSMSHKTSASWCLISSVMQQRTHCVYLHCMITAWSLTCLIDFILATFTFHKGHYFKSSTVFTLHTLHVWMTIIIECLLLSIFMSMSTIDAFLWLRIPISCCMLLHVIFNSSVGGLYSLKCCFPCYGLTNKGPQIFLAMAVTVVR